MTTAKTPSRLTTTYSATARAFTDRGVTFALGGEERPFPLDLVPRVIAAAEWDVIDRGVRQRVRALEAFLADVYGAGRAFEDGVLEGFCPPYFPNMDAAGPPFVRPRTNAPAI